MAQARDAFANPAVSGSVTLSFDQESVKLFPQDYTPALSLAPVDGTLVPQLDAAKLAEIVKANVVADGGPGRRDGRPGRGRAQGHPRQAGSHLRREAGRGRLPGARRRARRLAHAERRREGREAGVHHQGRAGAGDQGTRLHLPTYFPYAEYRNVNIGRAAELVNGTVLKPGETFSLNDTVGERTRENGFTEGYIISDGILVSDLGGGVSQMATTTFNAMFFAGLEDVEHKPHSFYIDRYPIGREATVAWGAVDLRFTNDTPYGVLISANVTPATATSSGVVTVSMYSTKRWDITTSESERYNITKAKVRRVDTLQCHANEGYGGFDIDVKRNFGRPGPTPRPARRRTSTRPTPRPTR